jgi:hypothetical protein
MKLTAIVGAALVLASTLSGCVVVPAEPVVYAAPPPPAAVVVRPAYRASLSPLLPPALAPGLEIVSEFGTTFAAAWVLRRYL